MKTILITGSSRGIGRAIAVLAHKKGYQVIVHGRTNSKELQSIHNQLDGSIKTYFDIGNRQQTLRKVKTVLKKVDAIDVLVNNAGIAGVFHKDITDVNEKKALAEFKTNVLGTIYCTQAVLPSMMKQKKGSIVNVSSIKGHPRLSTMSSITYATTKAGVMSLTKSLAKAYAEYGIRVNSISPGYIKTDMAKDWTKEQMDYIPKLTLIGRIALPEEIAPLVLFLSSDDASYITGEDILIDGGHMLKGK